jgi:hypothetical protein
MTVGTNPYRNLYHISHPKAASTWIWIFLQHPLILQYSGMKTIHHGAWVVDNLGPIHEDRQYPAVDHGTIASPCYLRPHQFVAMPKAEPWRAIVVIRDPRDALVSLYYSFTYSHPLYSTDGTPIQLVHDVRAMTSKLSKEDGLLYMMKVEKEIFRFHDYLPEWHQRACDGGVIMIKYEQLFSDAHKHWLRNILNYFEIPLPDQELDSIIKELDFESLGGSKRGSNDIQSHYRNGIPGEWRDVFTPRLCTAYSDLFGDLPERLGYEANLS